MAQVPQTRLDVNRYRSLARSAPPTAVQRPVEAIPLTGGLGRLHCPLVTPGTPAAHLDPSVTGPNGRLSLASRSCVPRQAPASVSSGVATPDMSTVSSSLKGRMRAVGRKTNVRSTLSRGRSSRAPAGSTSMQHLSQQTRADKQTPAKPMRSSIDDSYRGDLQTHRCVPGQWDGGQLGARLHAGAQGSSGRVHGEWAQQRTWNSTSREVVSVPSRGRSLARRTSVLHLRGKRISMDMHKHVSADAEWM